MEHIRFRARDYPGFYSFAPVDQPKPYQGFTIKREYPYYLFEIEPREGFDLPPMLSGKYTKLDLLQAQIDKYLWENPEETADTAYVEKFTKPGRGRPKKKREKAATTKTAIDNKEATITTNEHFGN
jgi:hypothetical protein